MTTKKKMSPAVAANDDGAGDFLSEPDLGGTGGVDLGFDDFGGDLFDDGGDDETGGQAEDPEEETIGEKLPRVMTAFQKRAKNEENRFFDAVDSEYWVAFCFQTRAQKEEFLAKLGILQALDSDKYVDGLAAARVLGIKIESPTPTWREAKASKRLTSLT